MGVNNNGDVGTALLPEDLEPHPFGDVEIYDSDDDNFSDQDQTYRCCHDECNGNWRCELVPFNYVLRLLVDGDRLSHCQDILMRSAPVKLRQRFHYCLNGTTHDGNVWELMGTRTAVLSFLLDHGTHVFKRREEHFEIAVILKTVDVQDFYGPCEELIAGRLAYFPGTIIDSGHCELPRSREKLLVFVGELCSVLNYIVENVESKATHSERYWP